ncbi:hypothetical protein L1987_48932 [Smallanthus sonchifolius]|uniref:Uncharacterized protein n=1 Tax=Smallanthus sonchifolius TaxID=185202 RepID=A0ACB9FTA8_9ASTR|nr:hypothetical protein L1987_48932 [Smallanthus sonchifolius]
MTSAVQEVERNGSTLMILSMGSKKFSADFRLMFRLLKLFMLVSDFIAEFLNKDLSRPGKYKVMEICAIKAMNKRSFIFLKSEGYMTINNRQSCAA